METQKAKIEILRHTTAHVLAEAVQSIWPEVKTAIGPVIDDGFYYDFYSEHAFTDLDFEIIEKKMRELIRQNNHLISEKWSKEKAIEYFSNRKEKFKLEIINEIAEEEVTVFKQGLWIDLCRGPHLQSTGEISAFKLLSVAGSYWRGDEKKDKLQRIYGTAFFHDKDLKEYLMQIEEAKKRDHRKLGMSLDLFRFHDLAPGSPFFLPNGAIIYNELVNFLRKQYFDFDYQEVITPQLYDVELYKTSGHYQNYQDNMFFCDVDEKLFAFKPMNCPGHCLMFLADRKSYRDLPIRYADFGRLHRFERTGTMHGLTRVRTFCQDDGHIYCTQEQLRDEIIHFIDMMKHIYHSLGMTDYKIFLSTRPLKRMGTDSMWDDAENALRTALENLHIEYCENPGDGAFYGPKLDVMFVDALKREWQLGTLQCDFNMPEQFKLAYIGEDNKEHRPVMLHRAILGSIERFIGVYLEHCAGKLPFWLSPVQIKLLSVTERNVEYAQKIYRAFRAERFRVQCDVRNEKLGYKIREAQMNKIPYIVIIGDQEERDEKLSLRYRDGSVKASISLSEILNECIDVRGR